MSGGIWTHGEFTSPQHRPGPYFNLIAQAIDLLEAGDSGTVLVVGRADWGPSDTFEVLTSEGLADSVFGTGLSMAQLVKPALRGGAARVCGPRSGGSTGAEAASSLTDGVGP